MPGVFFFWRVALFVVLQIIPPFLPLTPLWWPQYDGFVATQGVGSTSPAARALQNQIASLQAKRVRMSLSRWQDAAPLDAAPVAAAAVAAPIAAPAVTSYAASGWGQPAPPAQPRAYDRTMRSTELGGPPVRVRQLRCFCPSVVLFALVVLLCPSVVLFALLALLCPSVVLIVLLALLGPSVVLFALVALLCPGAPHLSLSKLANILQFF